MSSTLLEKWGEHAWPATKIWFNFSPSGLPGEKTDTRLGKILEFIAQKQKFGARVTRPKLLFLRGTCQVVWIKNTLSETVDSNNSLRTMAE